MEKIIEILKEIKPGAEINENTALIDEHIIDSLAMINLVGTLSDEFDVDISARDITPENFATPAAIQSLIERLEDED
ncbi:MAG: acyl carrier protein [Ruminococcaceae bacterium]|nr:acyl carrier protein [Oscillospiraceae bacterium]